VDEGVLAALNLAVILFFTIEVGRFALGRGGVGRGEG